MSSLPATHRMGTIRVRVQIFCFPGSSMVFSKSKRRQDLTSTRALVATKGKSDLNQTERAESRTEWCSVRGCKPRAWHPQATWVLLILLCLGLSVNITAKSDKSRKQSTGLLMSPPINFKTPLLHMITYTSNHKYFSGKGGGIERDTFVISTIPFISAQAFKGRGRKAEVVTLFSRMRSSDTKRVVAWG